MRILLLEDEPDLGHAIKRALSQERYVVDWVLDGSMAWNYLTRSDLVYTIAVLDWLVPKLSGLAVIQQLRDRGNALPVLMLTARDGMADKIQGLDAGADDYRVDQDRSRTHGGAGLGLAIAHHHHGTLTVQSQLNQGSCFLLRLPLARISSQD